MTRGPDIVYPVRRGDWNEELRYSLRSLSHVRHNRVWIVGHMPKWVRPRDGNGPGAYHVPRPQTSTKYRNATESLVEVANELGASLSKPFLLWNDDMYRMTPLRGSVKVFHMGPLNEVIDEYRRKHHTGAYWRGMRDTYQLLKALGFSEPLSYELHIPMPIYREPLLDAWKKGKHLPVLHIRTLYGNLAGLGGEYMEDVKVYPHTRTDYSSWPWLSSMDHMMISPMLKLLEERFPNPSEYEL